MVSYRKIREIYGNHGIYNDFVEFYSDSMGYEWDLPDMVN